MAHTPGRRSFHGRDSDRGGPRRSLRQRLLDAAVAPLLGAGPDNSRYGRRWGSRVTGGWEADRVWQAVQAGGGPAFRTLKLHAELGDEWLPWVFLILVIWRIGIQFLGFIARTRGLYLAVAVLAAIAIAYQGYLGGQLVYEYGIGTALYNGSSPSIPQPEFTGPATPIPTVYVPTETATPEAVVPTATPSVSPTFSPVPSASASPLATPLAASSPLASPAPLSAAPSPGLSPSALPTPAH